MESDMRNPIEVAQLEMQQKLGRCMLRLQQYERLLKVLVATAKVEGAPGNLSAAMAERTTDVKTMTLGTLRRLFERDYLVNEELDGGAEKASVDSVENPTGVPYIKMQFTMSMSTERFNQTSAALTELKDMRNDLVHHLIEKFDISNEVGCLAATCYLHECDQTIDDHLGQLKEWAEGQAKVGELAQSLWQSKEFENAFVHGINPDGAVRWRQSTIVECLLNAERVCKEDGWTSLDTAITFIMRKHRDQTPTLYGCKTWRQLLMKSELFEIRREAGAEASRGQSWYRSRVETQVSSFR